MINRVITKQCSYLVSQIFFSEIAKEKKGIGGKRHVKFKIKRVAKKAHITTTEVGEHRREITI